MPSRAWLASWLAALILPGCEFYSSVSETGDLGIGTVRDTTAGKLVSALPTPDSASRSLPVVIAVHGFTASTFETTPVAEYLRGKGFLVSQVLMGAHGVSLDEFKASTWRTWEIPVLEEYQKLMTLGYKNIGFVTASTGGSVVMELYTSGQLVPAPTRISMVAPLLDFADKRIGIMGILQALGASNKPSKATGNSFGHWYSDWSIRQLRELQDLTEIMKSRLRGSIPLPDNAKIQIFQSMGDKVVDPFSADIWTNGIKGGLVSLYRLDSDLHVPIGQEFIDDKGVNTWTAKDRATKTRIFEQIEAWQKP